MVRGSVCAVLAMAAVGSSVAVMGALRDFPVFAGQGFRFALAAVLLLGVLRLRSASPPRGAVSSRQWVRIGVLAALGMVGFNVAVVAAERDTDPALVGVIIGCAPVVIALVTPLVNRTAPNRRIVLAGLVVAVGAAVAQGLGSVGSVVGLFFSGCALAGEVAFALVAAPVLSALGALRVSAYACAGAAVLCVPGIAVTGGFRLPDTGQLLALLWLGVVVTACAYVLWFSAVGAIGPERAGLFTSLVPISAVAATALLGTGSPTWGHLIGAVVVLVGLLVGLTAAEPHRAAVGEAHQG
ncbi:DMT family transporter [Actinokineospora spheciospongiae]|uniref:DMT family transporter n=1 Tax=Actinokineospora spheciospongiae TaxID=909613 RepID=UPI00055457A7|nr:DMT family transporter [Actinokineospora spheciospongiae]PWW62664.1 EamA-like transporter family protein [Actinokineospora spheciospongiae]